MSSQSPIPRPPDTYDGAEAALIRDVQRLAQFHKIEGWGILGNGTRYLLCSCNGRARSDGSFWTHIIDALKLERGAPRKPKT